MCDCLSSNNCSCTSTVLPNGPQGEQGLTGPSGTNGLDGADGANGAGYMATSISVVTVGTGSKTFTTQTGLAYTAGARVRVSATTDPINSYMEGVVTSYNTGTGALVFTVDNYKGSLSFNSWDINLAGDVGPNYPFFFIGTEPPVIPSVSNRSFFNSAGQLIICPAPSAGFDSLTGYNYTTGYFTAPVTGLYNMNIWFYAATVLVAAIESTSTFLNDGYITIGLTSSNGGYLYLSQSQTTAALSESPLVNIAASNSVYLTAGTAIGLKVLNHSGVQIGGGVGFGVKWFAQLIKQF